MSAVTERLPAQPAEHLPIVLIHGAANSSFVWTYWQQALAERGHASYAVNLRGHGPNEDIDLSDTSMRDYADDVQSCIEELNARPIVMGWSMGGLIAMMVAADGQAAACVGLAPSTPTRKLDSSIEIRQGEFGAEEYGITSDHTDDQPAMADLSHTERKLALASLRPESRRARDERKAGIVIETLPCPLLIVTGDNDRQWPTSHYQDLWLDAGYQEIEGASHWGLVLTRRAVATAAPLVTDWVSKHTRAG